jgi:hypothetical protein
MTINDLGLVSSILSEDSTPATSRHMFPNTAQTQGKNSPQVSTATQLS